MWKNINVNKQNLKADSGKAVLIQMPHNSNYDGFSFWHPSKLVRNGKHSNAVSVGYTDDFSFKLVKYGSGKWNSREVISEITISVNEFEEAFGVMNDSIVPPKIKTDYETHKPTELAVEQVEVLEELKDE